MFLKLLLLFTVVPFVELALLLEVGRQIGVVSTLAIILVTGIAGAGLARIQGLAVIQRIRAAAQVGELPTDAMLDGILILAAGLVLLTPGFMTDLVGFFLLLPFGRRLVRSRLRDYFQDRVLVQRPPD